MTAVESAISAGGAELERSLFAQRFEQASPREREYMLALASLMDEGRPATGASIASRLGKTTHQLASHRARLIAKGTIVADGEVLDFVVPGLAGYVLRRRHEVAERP
jgi:hypothetical protein